jgi:hypothetical protein
MQANVLTPDKARCIAINIARLLELLKRDPRMPTPPMTLGNIRELGARGLAMICVAGIVSACAATPDTDAFSIYAAPGKYDFLDCAGITNRLKAQSAREIQLRELMTRANEAPGGSIVSAAVYQDDFNTVRADIRALHKAAEEKRCTIDPSPPAGESQPSAAATGSRRAR